MPDRPGFPARLYAPYFQTWSTDRLAAVARASGTKFFRLAFLESVRDAPATLAWNGSPDNQVTSGALLPEIRELRAMGGDVILTFGGAWAAQDGREIADACESVSQIAAAYLTAVTVYDVTRLDMNIEGRAILNAAGVDRRNKALRLLQDWAAAVGRRLEVGYTLPATSDGLSAPGIALLRNAVANGTRVDYMEPMAFDDCNTPTTDMGTAAIHLAWGVLGQLRELYPSKVESELRAMLGLTLMPGIDDCARATGVTTLDHARKVADFAKANGLRGLSIWAIQRDNGSCPGIGGSDTGSGLEQEDWAFSHVLEPFSGS